MKVKLLVGAFVRRFVNPLIKTLSFLINHQLNKKRERERGLVVAKTVFFLSTNRLVQGKSGKNTQSSEKVKSFDLFETARPHRVIDGCVLSWWQTVASVTITGSLFF